MKIEFYFSVTPEELETIANGMSAARCGMDSLVNRCLAQGDSDMAAMYARWREAFRQCDRLIPQSIYDLKAKQNIYDLKVKP